MRVCVASIAVMDGTGQRVQFLQRDRVSHTQVGGDQTPASQAGKIAVFYKLKKKTVL